MTDDNQNYRCSVLVEFAEPLTLNKATQLRLIAEEVIDGALTAEDDDNCRWLIEWNTDEIQTPGWAGGVAQLQPQVLQLAIATLQSLGYTTETAEIVGYSIERIKS